jgi:hypothetical protein
MTHPLPIGAVIRCILQGNHECDINYVITKVWTGSNGNAIYNIHGINGAMHECISSYVMDNEFELVCSGGVVSKRSYTNTGEVK